MVPWKTTFLYQQGVFHFHVSESECNSQEVGNGWKWIEGHHQIECEGTNTNLTNSAAASPNHLRSLNKLYASFFIFLVNL